MQTVEELSNLLNLERLDANLFRGNNYQTPWGIVFGGQVLAQSLNAARRTVPEDRCVHSMHAYFILPGDLSLPIIYDVERIRDGGSFTTRRVVAIQKGRPIFNMAASFQLEQEGLNHQITMPNVPPPEALLTDKQLAETWKKEAPDAYRRYQAPRPIEFRPVEQFHPLDKVSQPPFRHVWMRATGSMLDLKALHCEALAYASDYNLLGTSVLPHRDVVEPNELQYASIDHAMWFHRDFRMDDWLLYALDSPSASGTRGFNRGSIFTKDGKLVASVVQEGLIRKRRKK
ncbi:MAG: acyl-CoA thioesterase II [Chitinophagales bacterium]